MNRALFEHCKDAETTRPADMNSAQSSDANGPHNSTCTTDSEKEAAKSKEETLTVVLTEATHTINDNGNTPRAGLQHDRPQHDDQPGNT